MLAQQDETDIFLSFFELTPPVITDVDEAKVKLTAMGSVRATCVAKIAISKARVPGLIRAIQSQLDGESPVQQVDGV